MKTNNTPYAIIEKDGTFTRYEGALHAFDTLSELQDFYQEKIRTLIFLTPFRTIRERGFESHGDEPILAINVNKITNLTREQIEINLSAKTIAFDTPITPPQSDEEYARKVIEIQDREIAGGNICQMVLSNPYTGKIKDFSEDDAESAFRNALKQRGQYMTILFSDGNGQYFVSLTPEQHLQVAGDTVTMNPIAGTMKKGDQNTFLERLKEFIDDSKETNELFHVLDEELKMMEVICDAGGKIEGPFLRQNGAVVHTEYRLIGKRNPELSSLDMLRETLHAPTLVGGPIESAARLIKQYEPTSRKYYGGEIGILTPDGNLDTAILIRTAHFEPDGTVTIQAGAGITKRSEPQKEAEEVRLKTNGMQSALLGTMSSTHDVQADIENPEIQTTLKKRNEHLSKFHFLDQSENDTCEKLEGKTAIIIDNEDNFTRVLARMMRKMGMTVDIVKTADFDPTTNTSDIVVIGPGPGDINNIYDEKMRILNSHTHELIQQKRNLLGICLGHQAIAKEKGLSVQRMDEAKQGEQDSILLNGKEENVGFYNSFCPIQDADCEFDTFAHQIQIIKIGNISGFQFHPESVMSENGYEILKNELIRIIDAK